jgi:hypothetical protein
MIKRTTTLVYQLSIIPQLSGFRPEGPFAPRAGIKFLPVTVLGILTVTSKENIVSGAPLAALDGFQQAFDLIVR